MRQNQAFKSITVVVWIRRQEYNADKYQNHDRFLSWASCIFGWMRQNLVQNLDLACHVCGNKDERQTMILFIVVTFANELYPHFINKNSLYLVCTTDVSGVMSYPDVIQSHKDGKIKRKGEKCRDIINKKLWAGRLISHHIRCIDSDTEPRRTRQDD